GVPYRGVLVTRAIEGRRPLGDALRAASPAERTRWIDAAARAVRRLHACGVRHPDLNVSNLLVGEDPDVPIAIVDFDRAAVSARPVGALGRRLARRRLSRSIAKLGLPGLSRAECRRRLSTILEAHG